MEVENGSKRVEVGTPTTSVGSETTIRERVANVEHAAKELRERLEACRGRNADYLGRLRRALEVHDLEHLPGDSREGCALCKALQGL